MFLFWIVNIFNVLMCMALWVFQLLQALGFIHVEHPPGLAIMTVLFTGITFVSLVAKVENKQ